MNNGRGRLLDRGVLGYQAGGGSRRLSKETQVQHTSVHMQSPEACDHQRWAGLCESMAFSAACFRPVPFHMHEPYHPAVRCQRHVFSHTCQLHAGPATAEHSAVAHGPQLHAAAGQGEAGFQAAQALAGLHGSASGFGGEQSAETAAVQLAPGQAEQWAPGLPRRGPPRSPPKPGRPPLPPELLRPQVCWWSLHKAQQSSLLNNNNRPAGCITAWYVGVQTAERLHVRLHAWLEGLRCSSMQLPNEHQSMLSTTSQEIKLHVTVPQ